MSGVLPLHARVVCSGAPEVALLRLADPAVESPAAHLAVWADAVDSGPRHDGAWGAVLALPDSTAVLSGVARLRAVRVPTELAYLQPGDIVRVHPPTHHLNVLYRRASRYNALLVTERCNSYCLMCSQPPKAADDSFLLEEWLHAVPLMAQDTRELGITGGEPLLLGDRLFTLLAALRTHLPTTAVHLLTNGRAFQQHELARRLAAVQHPSLTVGIPLYSDLAWKHDFVVQAAGAFGETVLGLLHLARQDIRIELRVVLHGQTYRRLPELARYITRNLPFVGQVSLMGLELTGHTPMNIDALWIDPSDYQPELVAAVERLSAQRIPVCVFNLPLCILDPRVRPYAVASISDWKQTYDPVCTACAARTSCGGFFATGVQRRPRGLTPLAAWPDTVGQHSAAERWA